MTCVWIMFASVIIGALCALAGVYAGHKWI
jgi:hypothetical protein